MTDITEPKRVRGELERSQERFMAVLDGLDSAVYVADAKSDEILFGNRAFKSIFGFDAVGRNCWEVTEACRPPVGAFDCDLRLLAGSAAAPAVRRRGAEQPLRPLVPPARPGHPLGGRPGGAGADRHRHHRAQADRGSEPAAAEAPGADLPPHHHGRNGLLPGPRTESAPGRHRQLLHGLRQAHEGRRRQAG